MALFDSPFYCLLHVLQRFRAPFVSRTANDVFQAGRRERLERAQQHALRHRQLWASRTDFGSITCPFDESFVVSMDAGLLR
jgi:hypothetical protein